MTTPGPEPLADAFEALDELEGSEPKAEPGPALPGRPRATEPAKGFVTEVIDSAEAVVLGIGDTLADMLKAGREGARKARAEYWQRFDQKTKHRRKPPAA